MDVEQKAALNAAIVAQGHSEDFKERMNHDVPVKHHTPKANWSATEWGATGGTFQEHWPENLPRPPSMKNLLDEEDLDSEGAVSKPRAIVFAANTKEGGSLVRVLSEKGMRVTAVVRIVTSKHAKNLAQLRNVTLRVADLNDREAVVQASRGCQQAFLITKYWEKFESHVEENNAKVVLDAAAEAGIKRLILATFEDTTELRRRKQKSQIMPTKDGLIYPNFEGKRGIEEMAKELKVSIAHMMTSYLDEAGQKKSLVLIRGENGKILSQPHIQDLK